MYPLTHLEQARCAEIVLHFIQGERLEITQYRLTHACQTFNRRGNALLSAVAVSAEDPFMLALLNSLNLKPSHQEALFKRCKSLYALLCELAKEGHPQAHTLLSLAYAAKPETKRRNFFLAGLAGAGLGGVVWQQGWIAPLTASLEKGVSALRAAISTSAAPLKHWPFAGLFIHGVSLLNRWIQTLQSDRKSTSQKLSAFFLSSLTAGLTLAGFALCTLSGMTPWVAGLFSAAGAVDVLASALAVLSQRFKEKSALMSTPRWQDEAARLCETQSSRANTRLLWTQLGFALLTTTVVSVWAFYPPTPFITLGGFALLTGLSLAKQGMLATARHEAAEQLQTAIAAIQIPPEASLCPSTHPRALNLMAMNEALHQREVLVHGREQALTETLQALARGDSATKVLLNLGGAERLLPRVAANEEPDLPERVRQIPAFNAPVAPEQTDGPRMQQ